MKYRALVTPLTLLAMALPAYAQDADAPPLGEETCMPTQGMKEAMAKFDGLKPERIDTVRAALKLTVNTDDENIVPERIEIRDVGEPQPLTLDPVMRTADLTPILPSLSDEAQLCIVHPDLGDDVSPEDANYGISIGMGVRFLETPGTHTLAELEEGMKDGRAHYRKMAGAMGFMVPKFGHVAVAGADPENPPRLWATKAGEDLGEPKSEFINGGRLVSLDDVEDMGADGVRIEGDYRLSPSPDAKTVERFMR